MKISTEQDWNSTIDSNIQNIIVIIFISTWCEKCEPFYKNVTSILEQSPHHYLTNLYIVDIDTSTELVDKFNITSVPTTLIINKRKIVCRVAGAKIEELQKILV